MEQARSQVAAMPHHDPELVTCVAAAEQAAEKFLNRRVFSDQDELDAAVAAIPSEVQAAESAHQSAREAARELDGEARYVAEMAADAIWNEVLIKARETAVGMVVNDDIRHAILLMVGHLFRNREAVGEKSFNELPMGFHALLWPHRVGLGV